LKLAFAETNHDKTKLALNVISFGVMGTCHPMARSNTMALDTVYKRGWLT
jgi:hypothetical protein